MEMATQLIIDRLNSIEGQMREDRLGAQTSRGRMYEKLDNIERNQEKQGARVEQLERSMLTISPTVNEFATMKSQVDGAGKVGRGLWRFGKGLLHAAAGAAAAWAAFWAYFTWK